MSRDSQAQGPGGELAWLTTAGAEGLDRLYREYAPRVLGWTIRLGDPWMDPEDVTQEVFAIALRKLETFRGDSSARGWLFGITRNVLANRRRKARLRRFVGLSEVPEPQSSQRGADDELERKQQRALVQRALGRLSQEQREAIVLVDLEGASAREASELIGVPIGTVYSRLHHARRALAAALTAEGFLRAEPGGKVLILRRKVR